MKRAQNIQTLEGCGSFAQRLRGWCRPSYAIRGLGGELRHASARNVLVGPNFSHPVRPSVGLCWHSCPNHHRHSPTAGYTSYCTSLRWMHDSQPARRCELNYCQGPRGLVSRLCPQVTGMPRIAKKKNYAMKDLLSQQAGEASGKGGVASESAIASTAHVACTAGLAPFVNLTESSLCPLARPCFQRSSIP